VLLGVQKALSAESISAQQYLIERQMSTLDMHDTFYPSGINFKTNNQRVKETILDLAAYFRTLLKHKLDRLRASATVKKVPFHVVLMCDETTDISNTAVLQVTITYINTDTNKKERSVLGAMDCSGNQDAPGLYYLLQRCLKMYVIGMDNLLAFCTDDAANITGRENGTRIFSEVQCMVTNTLWVGLIALAREASPRLLSLVCGGHRVNTVSKKISEHQVVKEVLATLKTMAKLTSKSPKRRVALEATHKSVVQDAKNAASKKDDRQRLTSMANLLVLEIDTGMWS